MAEQKKKYEDFNTPEGTVKWANLMTAQTSIKLADGTVNPVDPNYNITLLLDPNAKETVDLIDLITKRHAAAYAAAVKSSKKKLIDQGLDNCFKDDANKEGPTGKVSFKFKHKAGGTKRDGSTWAFKPKVFDAYGAPLPAGTVVFGGSRAQVNFSINHTAMPTGAFYTSLSLNAAIITVLKDSFDKDASSFGFKVAQREVEEGQDAFGEQIPEGPGEGVDAHGGSDF